MANQPKQGRPKADAPKTAYQIRLEPEEAKALDKLVERADKAAREAGGSASAASVLRTVVRRALVEEGLLTEKGGKR